MTKYTVVGLYDDNDQIWVEIVDADNHNGAILKAGEALLAAQPEMDAGNILIASVFRGAHRDLNKVTGMMPVTSFPGWKINEDDENV